MFRPVQGHHQGGKYKDIQLKQILPNMCVCSEKNAKLLIIIIKNIKI